MKLLRHSIAWIVLAPTGAFAQTTSLAKPGGPVEKDATTQAPPSHRPHAAPAPSGIPGAPFTTQAAPPNSAPAAPGADDATKQKEAPPIEPWTGTLSAGLAEVRRLAEAEQTAEALELSQRLLAPNGFLRWKERVLAGGGWKSHVLQAADPVLEWLGLDEIGPAARAEVEYAIGVVASGAPPDAKERALAEPAFGSALALAGPGALRLDAGYQLATSALLEGEEWRAKIPEISGQNAATSPAGSAPGVPPGAAQLPAAAGAPNEPDPLAQARTAYQRAKEDFIARLRADWTDGDTRANTELVLRRLKELDEIEKKREEEKKKQEQQKQDKDKKDKQDKDDQDKKKQDQKDKDEQQQDKSKDQQDKKDSDKDQQQQDEQKKKEEQQKAEEQKKQEEKDKQQQPQPGEERELSKEEMTRLFDLLKQREDQWKKLQQQLQHARRGKVKKDW